MRITVYISDDSVVFVVIILVIICRYWLSVGAQPSEPVERILFRAGMLPPPPMVAMARKGGPRDIRPIDPMTGQVLTQDNPINTSKSDEPNVEPDEIVDTASTS